MRNWDIGLRIYKPTLLREILQFRERATREGNPFKGRDSAYHARNALGHDWDTMTHMWDVFSRKK